jgi:hypothetical protein
MKNLLTISSLVATTLLASVSMVGCSQETLDITKAVEFPNTYYIEYAVTSKDHIVYEVAKGVDENNNYYYVDFDGEYVFLCDGTYFDKYVKEDGVWTKEERVTLAYIDTFTEVFKEYANKGKKQFPSSFKKDGETTLLNRACTTYTMAYGFISFFRNFNLTIDNETNICMSYFESDAIGNGEKEGFECV